ncbi:MAG: Glu-tRNA(Gln) amidotransferase subunit GatE [archaeon]
MVTDYKKLGFKAGLEVHQQLNTGKLFCNCPSIIREDKPDVRVERRMHLSASELGLFDSAALEAVRKEKKIIFEAYTDTNCLIELDEEPPKEINKEALNTALEIALMTESKIFSELQIMRKTIVNGSLPSGFQRTILYGLGGTVKLSDGKKVGLTLLALEEDAGREIIKTENEVVYKLDRLGIPLIELVTKPELESPIEVKDCARKIGELVRRTGKARRGLGSIRQDVNVSINDGARVEIKGVQDLELIDLFAEREVLRQLNLLQLKETLLSMEARKEDFELKPINLTKMLSNSNSNLVRNALNLRQTIYGLKVKNFNGLLDFDLQPNRRVGSELADHVKIKTSLKGLIHSDELPGYGLSEREVELIEKSLRCEKSDGFVIVMGKEKECMQALKEIVERLRVFLEKVPEETRQALQDGNSVFLRTISGSARMYPETDLRPVKIEEKKLLELKKSLPLTVEERKKLYFKYKLSGKLVTDMILNNHARFFEELLKKKVNPVNAAVILLEGLTQLKREGVKVKLISNEMIEKLLIQVDKGVIPKDIQLQVLKLWSLNSREELKEILKQMKIEKVSDDVIKEKVKKIINLNNSLVKSKGERALKPLMGELMKEFKGKVDGNILGRILREELMKVLK